MSDAEQPIRSGQMGDSHWEVSWLRSDDVILLRYFGYLSDMLAVAAMDVAIQLFETAKGTLRIYTVVDDTQVTGFSPTILAAAVLHDSFFHPRSGKLYVVGASRDMRMVYDALNSRRLDSVRFADSIEAALNDIDLRRAAYHARQGKSDSEG
jgi:hypothetical protein